MANPYFDKKTPRKMCEAIDEIGDALGMKLARRPWNRFKATLTSWWLIPSPKQPHHQFGKYFFDWGDEEQKTIVAGLYVEKGLDKALRVVYPSRKGGNLIMRDDWAWFSLLKEMNSGAFKKTIENVNEAIPYNIEFHIDGGYVDDPGLYDPHASNLENDHYVIELSKDTEKTRVAKAKRKGMQLKALNKATDLDALIQTLQTFGEDQFLWFNTMVAMRFDSPFNADTPEGADIWDGQKIWDKFLSHFAKNIK